MHLKMLSAICFNLDQSEILSSGNGLNREAAMLEGVDSCNRFSSFAV